MNLAAGDKRPLLIAILSLVAIAVSAYLFNEHIIVHYSYAEGQSFCAISEVVNCAAAAKSDFSKFLGIPISLWGLGLYLITLIWAIKLYKKPGHYEHLAVIAYALFLGSVFYSITLGIVSWLIIKAFCPFCISLYFLNICIFLLLWSMLRTKLSIKKIFDSIFKQLYDKSSLFYLVLFIAVILGGLKYKHWWAYNHDHSVVHYKKYHNEKIVLDDTDYLTFGNKKAKTRIDIFLDYKCPYCEKANRKITQLLKEHGEKVVVYIHNFPLDSACNPFMNNRKDDKGNLKPNLHPGACEAAGLAIALQNKGFVLAEQNNDLYKTSLKDKDKKFADKAKVLLEEKGLSQSFITEMSSDSVKAKLKKEIDEAIALGIKSTPSIFVDGYPLPKIPDYQMLLKMLDIK